MPAPPPGWPMGLIIGMSGIGCLLSAPLFSEKISVSQICFRETKAGSFYIPDRENRSLCSWVIWTKFLFTRFLFHATGCIPLDKRKGLGRP